MPKVGDQVQVIDFNGSGRHYEPDVVYTIHSICMLHHGDEALVDLSLDGKKVSPSSVIFLKRLKIISECPDHIIESVEIGESKKFKFNIYHEMVEIEVFNTKLPISMEDFAKVVKKLSKKCRCS